MHINLLPEEARVIGCLMEKEVTTPDQYPLTLNALSNACNQKSSRHPIMNLTSGDVERCCRQLKDKHFIRVVEGVKNNTEKYAHRFCNTLLGPLTFSSAEHAIVCLLLLRGAQTPGELRSRSGRLFRFDDNQEVLESLKSLIECEGGPVVARLARQAGRQDHEYTHLFSGEIESAPEEATNAKRVPDSGRDQRIRSLETRVRVLEKALTGLAARLGEDIDLTEDVAELEPESLQSKQ